MAIGIPSEFAPGAPPIKIHPLLTGQKALVTEANALRRWGDDALPRVCDRRLGLAPGA